MTYINKEIFFNRNKNYFSKKFYHWKDPMLYIRPSMHNLKKIDIHFSQKIF